MKFSWLTVIFLSVSIHSNSQEMWGLQGGIGQSTTKTYQTNIKPTFGIQYLTAVAPHLYMGGSVFYENYSLLLTIPPNYILDSVTLDCRYLFLAPKLNVGIGQNEYIHLFFSFGAGVLISGQQTSYFAQRLLSHGVYQGTNYSTESNPDMMNRLITRIGAGITEHIHIGSDLDITLTEEFGYLPSALSKGAGYYTSPYPYSAFRTNYVSLQAGLMSKYRKAKKKVHSENK